MKKNIWTYIMALLCVVGGVYLIINPEQSFSNIVYYVGLIILISGIFKVIASFINKQSLLLPGNYFLSGILNALFGIILMVNNNAAIKIIPIIIGFWLIINSASNLALVFNLKRSNNTLNNNLLITNILKLILGIVVLTTPIITILFTGYIIGIILILAGIYMIINLLNNKKIYKVKVK